MNLEVPSEIYKAVYGSRKMPVVYLDTKRKHSNFFKKVREGVITPTINIDRHLVVCIVQYKKGLNKQGGKYTTLKIYDFSRVPK